MDYHWPGWGPWCTIFTAVGLFFVVVSCVLSLVHAFFPSRFPSPPSPAELDRIARATEALAVSTTALLTAANRTAAVTVRIARIDRRELREAVRQVDSLLTAIVATERQASKTNKEGLEELITAQRDTQQAVHDLQAALQLNGLENVRELIALQRALSDSDAPMIVSRRTRPRGPRRRRLRRPGARLGSRQNPSRFRHSADVAAG